MALPSRRVEPTFRQYDRRMEWSRRRRLTALALFGAAGLLIAVFIFTDRGADKRPAERADSSAPTAVFSPVPTPTPEPRPLIFDTVTHQLRPVPVSAGNVFPRPLGDGSLLMVDSPARRSAVVTRDGTEVTTLPPALLISTDGRYVVWADDQGLRAYEAGTRRIDIVPPRSIAGFPSAWLLPWGGGFGRDIDGRSIDIIASDGTLLRRLDMTVGASWVVPSADGRSFAWDDGAGLHVYNLNNNAERVLAEVQWVPGGEMSWSPDASQLAVLRLTGDNIVHIDVVNVASGARREIFHGDRAQTIALLPWLAPHVLTIRIADPFALAGTIGSLRILTDGGNESSEVPEASSLWRFCGPACGLPPSNYEVDGGIASWCGLQADESCQFRLAFVDRTRGRVSEIADSERGVDHAVSPNGRTLAMVMRDDDGNQTLRLVNLDDLSYDEYALPWAYGYSPQWFPDGTAIVLAFSGT